MVRATLTRPQPARRTTSSLPHGAPVADARTTAAPDARPTHHAAGGGFRNPWPGSEQAGVTGLLRWLVVERVTHRRPADPLPASVFPRVASRFDAPRAAADALTATWVGHSSFLVQLGGANVLLDPVWGERASPVGFAGPRRLVPPAVAFDALPPIDVVVLSHDHYDHLDAPTVRAIARRWPAAAWLAPLGVGRRLRALGAANITERDWWEEADVGPLRAACVPAQHFSGRGVQDRDRTLWCGWALRAREPAGGGRAVLYAGDTGLHPEFARIGRRYGPFDLALLPVGAYAPRWFMRPVHCDPDDAVAAWDALVAGAPGGDAHAATAPPPVLGAMHWGTFKLTDEAIDDPPRRLREAWARGGRPPARLWVPQHGETWRR